MARDKILILGYARHGKDTFANYLSSLIDVKLMSSSKFANESIIYPWFKERFPGYYTDADACFADRGNWRPQWHKLIADYNTPDRTRLARKILQLNDGYIGMRCIHEVKACLEAKLFQRVYWVDASRREPKEDSRSNSVHYDSSCMIKVDNNGTEDDLLYSTFAIISHIEKGF